MSSQQIRGQTTDGQGRTAVYFSSQGGTPTFNNNTRPQSDPITSTESYEQKLCTSYHLCEDMRAKLEAATAKLNDYDSLNRQLEITREFIKFREWEVQQMMKAHKFALQNAEYRAESAEKKLLHLQKENLWEHHRVISAAEVLCGLAAPENEIPDQIQDHGDSPFSSRKQEGQGVDNRCQIPQTRESGSNLSNKAQKPISVPNVRKRSRSEREK